MTLTELVRATTPDLNPETCGGYVRHRSQNFENYLNSIFRVMAARLPPSLTYQPITMVSPAEEFEAIAYRYSDRKTYDFSRTDTYLVKATFLYDGQPLNPVYIRVPYLNQGDILHLYGAAYSACPVLADKSITIKRDTIFVPLTCDRFIFTREQFWYTLNGARGSGYIYHSPIHHLAKPRQKLKMAEKTTTLHYLLAKFGLSETLTRLGLLGASFGVDDEGYTRWRNAGYLVYGHDARQPVRRVKAQYTPEIPLWFAFPPETPRVVADTFAASFYYMYSYNPHRFVLSDMEDTDLWKIILGRAIFEATQSDAVVLTQVNDHLKSVDRFVDDVSRVRFAEDGILVDDFYDLLIGISCNIVAYIAKMSQTSTSMYSKTLMVEYYYFEDVIKNVFKALYDIQKLFTHKKPSYEEVRSRFRTLFRTDSVLNLNRAEHPEVESASSPTPCMAYKLTSRLAQRAGQSKGSKRGTHFDPFSSALDASIAEVGNYLCITKSEPTGRGHLNPFVKISAEGHIVRSNVYRELIDITQRRLERT